MKTDWVSSGAVCVDFETQSPVDIRREGGRAYALDPRTRPVLMAAVECDGTRECLWAADHVRLPDRVLGVEVVRGRTPPDWVVRAPALVAHNALGFDAHVWRAAGWPEVAWRDTMPLCRAGGLPGGLDAACDRVLGRGKDPRGKAMVEALCKARVDSDGNPRYAVGTAAAWEAFAEYCVHDGRLLRDLHVQVRRYGEPRVLEVDAIINERGFPIDREFAVRLVELQRECSMRAKDEMRKGTLGHFDPEQAGSQQKFRAFCARLGVRLDSLDKRALREFMVDPLAFCECEEDEDGARAAVALLVLRAEIVRATQGKAVQMMAAAGVDGDGRARWQTVAYGAHTGRWTGRQVQPHNFARGSAAVDVASLCRTTMDSASTSEAFEAVAREAERASEVEGVRITPADVLTTMLRPCIAGDGQLAVADYGQVEARWVAKAAGEDWELELFRDLDGDVYSDVARRALGRSVISKDERWLFKQAVLGCLEEGTPVLTDEGFVPIEQVTSSHKVWDGEEFVSCDGAAFMGVRGVEELEGVRLTSDHLVLTENGWREAGTCLVERSVVGRSSTDQKHYVPGKGDGICVDVRVAQRRGYVDRVWSPTSRLDAKNAIGSGTPFAPNRTSRACCSGYGTPSHDAPIRKNLNTSTMVDEASNTGSETTKNASNISCRSTVGTIQVCPSTGSITMDITNQATYVLQREYSKSTTNDAKPVAVYDVLNAGPRRRFQAGSLIVHNCGYQMGYKRFAAMLVSAGKDPDQLPKTPQETVQLYREQHSKVKARWSTLEAAARECLETGHTRWVGWTRFEVCSEGLAMVLPSGRRLYYRGARVEMAVPRYCLLYNLPPVERPQITYDHPRGFRSDLYGGKLFENESQGGCRDIMADALVRSEDAAMRPILHVHDELVCAMDRPAELAELMSVAPEWADGFPILVEAFGADRYYKNPPKGSVKHRSMGGTTKSEVVR